jgi:hypothetical protein
METQSPQEKAWATRRLTKKKLREPGIKAAHKKEYRRRQRLAHEHDLDAKKWTRYTLTGRGWKYLSFETKTKHEGKGIVDMVAVRKRDKKDPDALEVRLLQVKGYGARHSDKEWKRLNDAAYKVKVTIGTTRKSGKGQPLQLEGFTSKP